MLLKGIERTKGKRKRERMWKRKRIWREAAAGRSVCLLVRFDSQFVCLTTTMVERDLNFDFDLDLNLEGKGGRTSSRGMLVQFSRHGKGWRPANGKADEGQDARRSSQLGRSRSRIDGTKTSLSNMSSFVACQEIWFKLEGTVKPIFSRSAFSGISDMLKQSTSAESEFEATPDDSRSRSHSRALREDVRDVSQGVGGHRTRADETGERGRAQDEEKQARQERQSLSLSESEATRELKKGSRRDACGAEDCGRQDLRGRDRIGFGIYAPGDGMEARQVSRKFASDGRTSMGIDGEDRRLDSEAHCEGTPSKGTREGREKQRSIFRRSLSEKERASAGL
ncbi:hypothetical protein B0H13DRAFT_1918007 [Mycena leptocephala]|nr:hypothetical protein B0H13DRAFT_1918007 [Mycena leptocephala]